MRKTNYLIDTHILLWWLNNSPQLSSEAIDIIDSNSNIFVSAASLWEMALKKEMKKLRYPDNILDYIEHEDFHILDIKATHVLKTSELPSHHQDPFDRLLIAQAQLESYTFITHDKLLQKYNIPLIIV